MILRCFVNLGCIGIFVSYGCNAGSDKTKVLSPKLLHADEFIDKMSMEGCLLQSLIAAGAVFVFYCKGFVKRRVESKDLLSFTPT